MCPPAAAPLADLDYNCANDELIMHLYDLQCGFPFPRNVIKGVNPYCHRPENLPDKIWYYIPSGERVAIVGGVWKPKGKPCRVFSGDAIIGWRTTLEFFEEQTPHSWEKTDWVMQEFKITPKKLGQSIDDVNVNETSLLCRVFRSVEAPTDKYIGLKYSNADSAVEKSHHPIPSVLINNDSRFEKGSTSNHQENDQSEKGLPEAPPTGPAPTDPAAENLPENDFISGGDYLEIRDLGTPGSPSSSSDNSSCLTVSSDECFDSLDLLQDLEPRKDPNPESRGINFSANTTASDGPDRAMTRTAASGASIINEPGSLLVQGAHRTDLPSTSSAKGKEKKGECSKENPSPNRREASPSSSDSEGSQKGNGRVKRHNKKYLCFNPFQFLL